MSVQEDERLLTDTVDRIMRELERKGQRPTFGQIANAMVALLDIPEDKREGVRRLVMRYCARWALTH